MANVFCIREGSVSERTTDHNRKAAGLISDIWSLVQYSVQNILKNIQWYK